MMLVLATRCVPGIPSALRPLGDDRPRAALFSDSSHGSREGRAGQPQKNCWDADGKPAWCSNSTGYVEQAIKPGMDPMGCHAAKSAAATTSWCQMNCADHPPNCPPDQCECTSVQDMAKISQDEAKEKRGALPIGGDPSTCKAISGAATDEWCISNCGDKDPLCPDDLCVCSKTAKMPAQPDQAAGDQSQQAAPATATWDPRAVPTAPTTGSSSSTASEPEKPPEAISSQPAIFPGGDPATCASTEGPAGATTEWCKNNCADVPPNCPSDICTCAKKGDPTKEWPKPKPVKKAAEPGEPAKPPPTWDPSTIPAPAKWTGQAPDPPKPAIFPGGDPKSCDKVEGQMISSTEWCQLSCADVPPNCPSDLCVCTKQGDPKKQWPKRKDKDEQAAAKEEQARREEEEQRKKAEEERKAQEQEEEKKRREAAAEKKRADDLEAEAKAEADRAAVRKDAAEKAAAEEARKAADKAAVEKDAADRAAAEAKRKAEEAAQKETPWGQPKEPDESFVEPEPAQSVEAEGPAVPEKAAPSALKEGGDPAGCVAAEGQTMSSTAWCVENCPGSLCTTDLCKCGPVHTIPQAIHPGGDPKTCTAVPGQLESNDAWCVNNCDVENWKQQPPKCPSNLCHCKVNGDKKKKWTFAQPAEDESWDPAKTPTWNPDAAAMNPPSAKTTKGWDPSTVPTYQGPSNEKPKWEEVKQAIFPGGDPKSCSAVDKSGATTEWCTSNCADVPPNCPAQMCSCSDEGDRKKHWPKPDTGVPKRPPAPKGKPGTSAIKPGQDSSFCVAADGTDGVSDGWCIMMCGLGPNDCDASMCFCHDVKMQSAIWPGGDPTSCKAKANSGAEDQWCVDNCSDEPPKCPDYLCKCSKPGNPDKAPGTELPKGVKDAPLQSALPKGGDPASCIALQGKYDPADPDKPTDEWCKSNCGTEEGCPVEKCFCADENAILTFDGDDATSADADGIIRSEPVQQNHAEKPASATVAERHHSAQWMCKEYGQQCDRAERERKASSDMYHAQAQERLRARDRQHEMQRDRQKRPVPFATGPV